jgi:L-histidine N-alpha-methyltransferase
MTETMTIDVHLDATDMDRSLRDDVYVGLTSSPKTLPPKWFYDDVGSQLFDDITRLPEYYPTRREREILEARAGEIATASGATALVELGSGTSTKTRLLLDALRDAGTLQTFAPFDCSETTLREAGASIAAAYPGVAIHGAVGDFERHLSLLPGADHTGSRLVAFLGGTIGNLAPAERAKFLDDLAAGLSAGEHLLLGTDLVKDRDRLVAAYDDTAGVTAAFNRNVLAVVNRSLDADFDLEWFEHVARWNDDEEWIEMRLRSDRAHEVHVRDLDLTVAFATGEEVRTEISAKFRREGIEAELKTAGFDVERWWTDSRGDFALSLAVRT